MSEQIDLTKPLWTKRGGKITKVRNTGEGRFCLCCDEEFGANTVSRWWSFDGIFDFNGKHPEMNLTNNPPTAQKADPEETSEPDNVNHPAHYTAGSIECIDAIQAALTPEEFRGYCKGNAMKYAWRERHKGGDESLKKAQWYLNRITEEPSQ